MPRKLNVTQADLSGAHWRSAGTGREVHNRVEVATVSGGVAMRDSDHPSGPVLLFTRAEWEAFAAGVRDGEFDVDHHDREHAGASHRA
jgi:hypothetical protein